MRPLSLLIAPLGIAACAGALSSEPQPSRVIRWKEAEPIIERWGQMRKYFSGETAGTRDLFTALTRLDPGQAVQTAHHLEEELLVVTHGRGTWQLDGQTIRADEGDVLYVAPWVSHGLTNTGSEPMQFFVIKWTGKNALPPRKPEKFPP